MKKKTKKLINDGQPRVQVFHYVIITIASLDTLALFQNHRRLNVFFHKGTKCVCCDRVGTQLIQGKDFAGHLHWDVYTDDLYPLTVDHILPKSKGGKNTLDNLQPMCAKCNFKKSNNLIQNGKELTTEINNVNE